MILVKEKYAQISDFILHFDFNGNINHLTGTLYKP